MVINVKKISRSQIIKNELENEIGTKNKMKKNTREMQEKIYNFDYNINRY